MSCAPIDTDGPRFTVLTVTGYSIYSTATTDRRPILSATVYDRFYMRDIATFRSTDRLPSRGRPRGRTTRLCPECGGRKARHAWICGACAKRLGVSGPRRYGEEGALVAAVDRCAELNAWHEREGWGE